MATTYYCTKCQTITTKALKDPPPAILCPGCKKYMAGKV